MRLRYRCFAQRALVEVVIVLAGKEALAGDQAHCGAKDRYLGAVQAEDSAFAQRNLMKHRCADQHTEKRARRNQLSFVHRGQPFIHGPGPNGRLYPNHRIDHRQSIPTMVRPRPLRCPARCRPPAAPRLYLKTTRRRVRPCRWNVRPATAGVVENLAARGRSPAAGSHVGC